MRFGTFSYTQARPWATEKQAYEELLQQILLTERLGFGDGWFAEHHHSDYGMLASPNLIIAALARQTQHLRFGNLVSVLPLYDPMRFAEECGMLDILTNGRLNVGLGRGVPKDDMKHRLDRDTAQARFEEGIEILLRAWTGETFSYSGKAWGYEDISCRPLPLQKPHPPIFFGGESEPALRRVADIGQGWLGANLQPEDMPAKLALLDRLLAKAGRSRKDIKIYIMPLRMSADGDAFKRYEDAGVEQVIPGVGGKSIDDFRSRLDALAKTAGVKP